MTAERRRPRLDRQQVIAAALQLLDADGLDGLTMRALGRQLGVDPMAAYHHVPNKEAILDGVVEAVWSEIELPDLSGEVWESLDQIAQATRSTLRRHPNALPIMATRPNFSGAGFRVVDRTVGLLIEAGMAPIAALETVNAVGEFLLGHALAETSPPVPGGDAQLVAAVEDSSDELPHLRRALGELELELASMSMDTIFERGLSTLLAGIRSTLGTASDPSSTLDPP